MTNRSTFPNSVDTFIEHFDIRADDVPKVKRYQALKLKSDLTASESTELENLTTVLRDKIITSEDWNKFQDALVNMQTFIKDEVEGYIQEKQTEFQNEINKFRVIGDYSPSASYSANNMVRYEACLYLCKKDCKDIAPSNTTYWELISSKGDQGISGVGLSYRGEFDTNKTYYKDDLVRFDNGFYYALKESKNVLPTNTDSWCLYMLTGITQEQFYNSQIQNILGV